MVHRNGRNDPVPPARSDAPAAASGGAHVNREGARAMTGEPNRRQLEPGPRLTQAFVPGSAITNVIQHGDEGRSAERGAAMPFPHATPDPGLDPDYDVPAHIDSFDRDPEQVVRGGRGGAAEAPDHEGPSIPAAHEQMRAHARREPRDARGR